MFQEFMNNIDNEAKAYFLGWIASVGTIDTNTWSISIFMDKKDVDCLKLLRNIIDENIPIKDKPNTNLVGFSICSVQVCQDVCRHLKMTGKCEADTVHFPRIDSQELSWVFLRGYFDGNGNIVDYNSMKSPECSIVSISHKMLESIQEFTKIPGTIHGGYITYTETNCIDFLGNIYELHNSSLYLESKYQKYVDWSTCSKEILWKIPTCYVFKTDVNAVFPSKSKPSDVGYDLTVIKEEKKWLNNITLYDTGLKLRVHHGYYAEVVPRSSLSKSGYMLANNVGIIDPNYNGNILVALIKVDPNAQDIVLPFRCCQIIFRRHHNFEMIEVAEEFEQTTRDIGGFGSTG